MVDQIPELKVLAHPSAAAAPQESRSQWLLRELAAALRIPADVAMQQALTHALSAVQRRLPLDVVLPFETLDSPKRGVGDV